MTEDGLSDDAIFVTSSFMLLTALTAVISIFFRLTSFSVAVVTSAFAPAAMLAMSKDFFTFGNGVGVGVFPAPPPPPLPVPAPAEVGVGVEAALTVTLVVDDSLPPGVPETDSVSVHVAADEPAVTDQLCEDDDEPAIVPIDLLALDTVQPELLDNVAVTPVVLPAFSVPAFWIVAETVNEALVETDDDDGVSETIFRSAEEVTVTCVQSAVHVPRLTHTSCEPAVFGVMVKERLLDSPELMLGILTVVVEPVNQLPSSVAMTLVCDCDCWFVTLASSVPDVPVDIDVVPSEHVYCDDEHALLHAASDKGTLPKNAAMTATISEINLFISSHRLKAIRRRCRTHRGRCRNERYAS